MYSATDLHKGDFIGKLRCIFIANGVSEEVTLNRATVFTGHEFQESSATWCVYHSPQLWFEWIHTAEQQETALGKI